MSRVSKREREMVRETEPSDGKRRRDSPKKKEQVGLVWFGLVRKINMRESDERRGRREGMGKNE